MEIGIQIRYAAWLTALPEVKQVTLKAAEAALAMEPHLQVRELSIVLADDAMLRTLNNDYRRINKATNVLAFAYGCNEECAALGDVIISLERTAAEAKQDECGLSDHLSHLVIHGVLHLLGYDHGKDDDAEAMEALETRALAEIGIDDPYAPTRRGEVQ